MTDHRNGEDRRTEEGRKLAGEKQAALTGGNTNYYLTDLGYTVVETEDIIERLQMEFAPATTFKSTDRLCKLRLGLGKPGSTVEYEVGKIVYYNNRTFAVSSRRERATTWFSRTVRWFRDVLVPGGIGDVNDVLIDVPDPKRLAPYSFMVGDFINALKPSPEERRILENVFKISLYRLISGPPHRYEIAIASDGIVLAEELDGFVKLKMYK